MKSKRILVALATVASAVVVGVPAANATSSSTCRDNSNPPNTCRATTAESKVVAATVDFGVFTRGFWRLTCQRGDTTTTNRGYLRSGRDLSIQVNGNVNCILTARGVSDNHGVRVTVTLFSR